MSGKRFEPHLKRAEEIQASLPLIAYYVRLYVTEKLMELHRQKDTTVKELLIKTLDECESARKVLDLSNGQDEVETFVMGVFSNADDEDRKGTITAATARKFYVASLFIDILEQFYEGGLPEGWEEKRKYTRYKAADIRKCLQAGTTPKPGAPGEDLTEKTEIFPPPKMITPSVPSVLPVPAMDHPEPVAPPEITPYGEAATSVPAGVSQDSIKQAKKLSREAADSLEFDDIAEAVPALREALRLLGHAS